MPVPLLSPRINVNRMYKLARWTGSYQHNNALDSGRDQKESMTPLKRLKNYQ